MATLYETKSAIYECADEEKLNALMMERNVKLEGVALWIKNLLVTY